MADRPEGFRPENAIGYMHLLPLSEIIASVLGVENLGSRKVWSIYNSLVARFGNEYNVLIDAGFEQLCEVAPLRVAEAIVRVRDGRVKVVPGYDGVYGQIIFFEEEGEKVEGERKFVGQAVAQKSLTDFM